MKNTYFSDDDCFYVSDSDIEYDIGAINSEPYFEYDNKSISCSFTGHRIISEADRLSLLPKLKSVVAYLVSLGVKEFHCGGALGFDTLAAAAVLDERRQNNDIKLILELPYENQADKWKENSVQFYEFTKQMAQEIYIHSDNPKNKEEAIKALLKRNRILVDKCGYLVCYKKHNSGGTAYTVNYAKLHDITVLEVE